MEENTHKVVVCTGSGRHGGLGEAILLRFASEGYHVVVTDIGDTGDRHLASSSDMESVAAGLKSTGGRRALSSVRCALTRLGSRFIW